MDVVVTDGESLLRKGPEAPWRGPVQGEPVSRGGGGGPAAYCWDREKQALVLSPRFLSPGKDVHR